MHPTAKVSEGTNRKMPASNTLVQLLVLYTNPESHNAQSHRQTDGQRDGRQDDANSRAYCVVCSSIRLYDRLKNETRTSCFAFQGIPSSLAYKGP